MKALMLAFGGSIHSQRVLQWLLQRKCEVMFCDATDPLPLGAAGYSYLPYPRTFGERYFRRLLSNRASNAIVDRSVIGKLRRIWPQTGADLAHVHFVDRRAHHCVEAGIHPLVLTVFGSDINRHFRPGADKEYRRVTGRALAKADMVITDAAELADRCKILAGRSIRTELLPLGIDTTRFRVGYESEAEALRKQLNLPADARVLLSIRAFAQIYQHHLILEAFAKAAPNISGPAYLVFKIYNRSNYREADSYEKQLRRRIDDLGISDKVRWMEEVPHEQLPAVYAMATAIINYPIMDGFPVTFMEAAACERPVITVRLPAYAGTFAERYFTLVDPEREGDLAAAIAEVLNESPDARRDRVLAARREVERDYDERVSAAKLIEIYRKTLNGKSA